MPARPHFQKLVERVRLQPPLAAGVVFPCDREALQMAFSGAFAGYVDPTLIGPERRIRATADQAGLDISRMRIVDTADDPRAATAKAIELAHQGAVAAFLKGSLGNEDLLGPVAAQDSGLRTESRLSHAYFVDIATQPRGYVLADAQMNVTPNLAAKRDIVRNTVHLARALGIAEPKVALLAAMDGAAAAFSSTTDAVALKSMGRQGRFPGAVIDGPLTPDSALSPGAAAVKGVKSEIAGLADVLIAPSMESALMVLCTMLALSNALAAGIVLGARIPIVAPMRHDSIEVRMASCVLASLVARAEPMAAAAVTGAPALRESGAPAAA
ncbi:MAG: bifunctional enoyl-CoA hydratase/phosphate acetyltransferase [Burkholderiales bacterium]